MDATTEAHRATEASAAPTVATASVHLARLPCPPPQRRGTKCRLKPDAKIFTIFEGTSEIRRNIIGWVVLGLDVR
jgi:alkylation response protein AidB-like acyl-CoA dehydrogenase